MPGNLARTNGNRRTPSKRPPAPRPDLRRTDAPLPREVRHLVTAATFGVLAGLALFAAMPLAIVVLAWLIIAPAGPQLGRALASALVRTTRCPACGTRLDLVARHACTECHYRSPRAWHAMLRCPRPCTGGHMDSLKCPKCGADLLL